MGLESGERWKILDGQERGQKIAQAVMEEIKFMITTFSGIGSTRMVKERRLVGGDIAR